MEAPLAGEVQICDGTLIILIFGLNIKLTLAKEKMAFKLYLWLQKLVLFHLDSKSL